MSLTFLSADLEGAVFLSVAYSQCNLTTEQLSFSLFPSLFLSPSRETTKNRKVDCVMLVMSAGINLELDKTNMGFYHLRFNGTLSEIFYA